jgi:hypothetical protein
MTTLTAAERAQLDADVQHLELEALAEMAAADNTDNTDPEPTPEPAPQPAPAPATPQASTAP